MRTRTLDAELTFVLCLFFVVQVLDGYFTYLGVSRHGLAVEANPIIATLIGVLGAPYALLLAKSTCVLLGCMLTLHRQRCTLYALTLWYSFAAVIPWVYVLTTTERFQ